MDEQNLQEIDEIKSFFPENQNKVEPKKIEVPQIKTEEKKKRLEAWEKYLGGVKILSQKQYKKLSKANLILKVLKYIFLAVFLIALIILLINFIVAFRDKDFTKETIIEVNNSVNPINNIQNSINSTAYVSPDIYLNVTTFINIDKIILNNTNGT